VIHSKPTSTPSRQEKGRRGEGRKGKGTERKRMETNGTGGKRESRAGREREGG